MSILDWSAECPRCGCTGLHACIGHRPVPMTPEEEARLEETMRKIFGQVAEEEERAIIQQAIDDETVDELAAAVAELQRRMDADEPLGLS